MAVSFYTQSRKEIAPIWIRIREGSIDAKARTLISVQQDRLVKSKVVLHRITTGEPEHKNILRQKNDFLNVVQIQLDALRREVQSALNRRDGTELIDSQWIKNIVQPTENINLLSANIDAFLDYKKPLVKTNTYRTYTNLKTLINRFEKENSTLLVSGINLKFRDKFLKYLNDNGYSNSTTILYIRILTTILKHAKKRGVKVSDDIDNFKDDLKNKKTLNVYLTLDEIKRIFELKDLTPQESIARDWLVISCNTAQRVGDLLKYDKKDIKLDILTVQQTKNENSFPIRIPLLPQVKDILKKYVGNFPPQLHPNPQVSYVYYNRLIKQVCRKAEINDEVKTLTYQKNNIKEDEVSKVIIKKKWEVVSSHIGRRSFATNYYGKMPTALIQAITGHKTESSFLLYIDRDREVDIENLSAMMLEISKQ